MHADDYTIDLDTFAPAPTKAVRFQGHTYPVRAFMDLPVGVALALLRQEKTLVGLDSTQIIERHKLYVRTLVPDMPDEVVNQLTTQQLTTLAAEAMTNSHPPQQGSAGPSGSASSSPALPGSTGGTGTASGR